MSATADNRMFFYGTLMSGHGRGGLLSPYGRPVARGTIRGGMHQISGGYFPAFVTGDGIVHGEVWEANDPVALLAMMRTADGIESYHADNPDRSMYLRERHQLLTAEGDAVPGESVWVYRWNPARGADRFLGEPIPSGDWRSMDRERVA